MTNSFWTKHFLDKHFCRTFFLSPNFCWWGLFYKTKFFTHFYLQITFTNVLYKISSVPTMFSCNELLKKWWCHSIRMFVCMYVLLLLLLLLHLLDHSRCNCEKLRFHNIGIVMMNLSVTAALGSRCTQPSLLWITFTFHNS